MKGSEGDTVVVHEQRHVRLEHQVSVEPQLFIEIETWIRLCPIPIITLIKSHAYSNIYNYCNCNTSITSHAESWLMQIRLKASYNIASDPLSLTHTHITEAYNSCITRRRITYVY